MTRPPLPLLLAVAGACALGGLGLWLHARAPVTFTPDEVAAILRQSPLDPPPPDPTNRVADDPRAARLGQALFFDPRLSRDGRVSCATCHEPRLGWSNGKALGMGLAETQRHVPSLWNVAYARWYFWDGRADTLWSQALQPLENPKEMGGERGAVVRLVRDDAALSAAYEAVFGSLPEGDPPAPEELDRAFVNVGKAIAAYERRIVSRRAPFDVFAEGLRAGDVDQQRALSASAQRGLKTFIGRGNCIFCHGGPTFSDGEFHDIRLPQNVHRELDPGRYEGIARLLKDPFNGAGRFSDDPGRRQVQYLVVRGESWGQFKTPSLRNVAQSAPYMHTGVFATLDAVLEFYSTLEDAAPMGHHDESIIKPLHFTAREKADLRAFLEALTGEALPADLTVPLTLPAPPSAAAPAPGRAVARLRASGAGPSRAPRGSARWN